ncbi:hypothetical protein GCM10008949_04670 [Deinococcus humi]|nr:hypothetical protein GCM10008949_04670 [Deinococcus humi]
MDADLLMNTVFEWVVGAGLPPCQKPRIPESVWRGVLKILPRVRELAGTSDSDSGAYCFGAVIGAVSVAGVESE